MEEEVEQRAGDLAGEASLVEEFFVAGKDVEESAAALDLSEQCRVRA